MGWTLSLPRLDSLPFAAGLLPFRGWTPPLPRLDSSQSRMDMTNTHITKEEGNKISIEVRDQHPSKRDRRYKSEHEGWTLYLLPPAGLPPIIRQNPSLPHGLDSLSPSAVLDLDQSG
ncbi:hypothetical protein Tco_0132225 [Tanacetum coccineum]